MRVPHLVFLSILALGSGCTPAGSPAPRQSGDEHDEHDEHDDHQGGEHDEHQGGEDHDDHDDPDEHDETGRVTLSADAVARSGIRTSPASPAALEGGLRFTASVAFNPDQVAHVSPLVEGQLVQVSARVGQEVEAGAELATLRSVELGAARAELSRANAMLEVATQTSERQQRLRSEGINSERSLLDAQLTEEQARAERDAARSWLRALDAPASGGAEMALRSPIAGEIVERHATRGESVSTADTLFVIADLDEVWVIGNALQDQVHALSVGMPAQLSLMAYPGRVWEGQVDYIGAIVDAETRTLPVRVVLANPDRLLRPGLAGEMTLQAIAPGPASASATIPAEAVQDMEGRSIVFVPGDEPSTFDVRPVTIGANDGHSVAVITGLEVGEEVVVAGAFVLLSEFMRDELGHGHAH